MDLVSLKGVSLLEGENLTSPSKRLTPIAKKMTPAFAKGSIILSIVVVAIAALNFFVSVAAAIFFWEISK
jgi:hypothetical protein